MGTNLVSFERDRRNPLAQINRWVGRTVTWLILLMVLLQFTIVLLRYVFAVGSILLQELVIYLHATTIMLAIAYTWQCEGHVRLDIFFNRWSPRRQAQIDLLGSVFLVLPLSATLWWFSWRYVADAWQVRERSSEFSGLPFVYLLKSLLLIFAVLLAIQAMCHISTCVRRLSRRESAA
jgi:TRAP-type mannitol/chloroaromatic compound transport system permease small subunit